METELYKPFPVGTVRGPYTCGKGNDPAGGVQFTVKGENGWFYFIESFKDEKKCREKAENYAQEILKQK